MRFCTTHRLVRFQNFGNAPGMLSHFHLYNMVTAGEDTGSYEFEKSALWEHVRVYRDIFEKVFDSGIELILSLLPGYKAGEKSVC